MPGSSNHASNSGPGLSNGTPPDLNGLPALANAASARRPSFALDRVGNSPLDAATTETLERQPRLASGYEWDERQHSVNRGQDGTACLSVEPDGDGYLGESLRPPYRTVLTIRFRIGGYFAPDPTDYSRRCAPASASTVPHGADAPLDQALAADRDTGP